MQISNQTHFQFFIIGGGVAGLSFAIQAARKGHTVAVAEKNHFPHHKVCGEYISRESEAFLQWLLPDFPLETLPRLMRTRITSANGASVERQLSLGGIGISRYLLDNLLYHEALKCGAVVFTQTAVTQVKPLYEHFAISTDSGIYTAEFVIGAFGKRSAIDILLNRKFTILQKQQPASNFVGIKYHVHADLPDDVIELHNFPGGYCGISKVEGNKYCLCYLVHTDWLKYFKGDIKTLQQKILGQNIWLDKYLKLFPTVDSDPVTISNIWFGNKSLYEQGIYMVGDAAGMVAPLSGNGMSMALHASYLLFNTIDRYMQGHIARAEVEKVYAKEWKRLFAQRVARGRILQRILIQPAASNMALKLFNRLPFLLDHVIKSTHGEPFFAKHPK